MTTLTGAERRRVRGRLLLAAAAWFAAVAAAGAVDLFAVLPRLTLPFLVVLAVAGPMLLYVGHGPTRAYVAGLGLRPLTAFHLWRVPAALVFFWYGRHGLLPAEFVEHAAWGDLAAGLLAAAAVALPARRWTYATAHLAGAIDFVLAVGAGVALNLQGEPLMATIGTFPVVLIPLLGVPLSATAHLAAFDLLLRRRQHGATVPGVVPASA